MSYTEEERVPVAPLREAPSTGDLTADEKQWGMFCHLSALAGLVTGLFFIGPLICWLIKKDTSRFVDYHGKESLNFQINIFILGVIGAALSLVLIGIPVVLAAMVLAVVMPIIAGLKANEGELYQYPYIIRLIK